MLFLQPPADAAGRAPAPLPILEVTALTLERALLAGDDATRLRELAAALASDRNAAAWAIRAAELSLARTVNRIDEAAAWLCSRLEIELAAALTSDVPDSTANEIGWRLPALVAKLHANQRQSVEFDRRLEYEKLESLKELAYGASHEINNPLANIAAWAQTLLEDETDSERQRKLVAIHRQAMRAHEMIADLMLFARPPKLRLAPCVLQPIVRRVVDEASEPARERGVELSCECEDQSIELVADETQLAVAIGAVVKNAIEAVGEAGQVQVTVRNIVSVNAEFAEILVTDNGPGISDNVRRHMFDPFFSGREAGRGLGFGASKCWRIVTDHGGQVIVNRRSGGAEISIQLPLGVDRRNEIKH